MTTSNIDEIVGVLTSPSVIDALQKPGIQRALRGIYPPSYESYTIWILIITVLVAAISALLIWLQLRADHERSRRELAVNLLREWTNRQEIETSSVIRFVRILNRDQCEKLAERKLFLLENTSENRELLQSCLEYKFNKNFGLPNEFNTGQLDIHVDSKYSIYIALMPNAVDTVRVRLRP